MLDSVPRPWFSGRVQEIDEDAILEWRRMVAGGKKQGITFGQPDLFIGAIASLHDLMVVARNIADFERAGVPVLNPWEFEG